MLSFLVSFTRACVLWVAVTVKLSVTVLGVVGRCSWVLGEMTREVQVGVLKSCSVPKAAQG